MFEASAIILVFVWLLALIFSQTFGGAIHLMLVAAFAAIVLSLFRGRNTLI